ncbi:MAG: hypothetical protein A2951_01715 [Candidatus Buchananbacteria bacterium RIFCSPLOWO2_01_FULL_56_15]|uniref:PEP-utilising enzyme mobile domain-containing protein n=1 Tax=Candidatus Buchananbacteria bacterium RIFCSPLOWO2_01_FULL_56_15 TaxID=1797547 RepID=A0A1G1YQY1_9BACT|nr:MAG: hypothetical protein A2951_01715 [Candidatus Buchananbacteria bacterium RIFCSPLOWO2_01_FULL_56_15]
MANAKKLFWEKYLTREYSFLLVSYALESYKKGIRNFALAHGMENLVSIYGIKDDVDKCYRRINQLSISAPKRILQKMDAYDELASQSYQMMHSIQKENKKAKIKELLIGFDKTFFSTFELYLFFVYLGYGGDRPGTAKFLERHGKRFDKIRSYTVDTDVDKAFPQIYEKYDKRLKARAPYMTREELQDFLHNGSINKKKISDRKKRYLLMMKNKKIREYTISEINAILKKELPHLNVNRRQDSVKGTTACRGITKGTVTVIFSAKDYSKIKQGAIIVTPMTKPTIVPYLSKANGIVTNDGGALSHASIISREMSIPCVVGTVHATDVFKDGDKVEVDANKGVVKKIK